MRLAGRFSRPVAALLVLLTALGTAMAVRLAVERHRADLAARRVAIAVAYGEVVDLAGRLRLPPDELFRRLREAGVTAVLAKEQASGEVPGAALLKRDDLPLLRQAGGELVGLADLGATRTDLLSFLVVADPEIFARLTALLEAKGIPFETWTAPGGRLRAVASPATPGELTVAGLGFPIERLRALEEAGFDTFVQLKARDEDVEALPVAALWEPLTGLRRLRAVFFNDKRLPGFPERMAELEGALRSLDVPAGIIEGFPQQGLVTLTRRLDHRAVRLHTIQEVELRTMPFEREVERYRLAAAERTITVLLIRIYPDEDPQAGLQRTLRVVATVRRQLEAGGFRFGAPAVPALRPVTLPELAVLTAGLAAAAALAGDAAGLAGAGAAAGLLILIAGAWATAVGLTTAWMKLGAFVATVVYPTLGVLAVVRPERRTPLAAAAALAAATAVSTAGGLVQLGFLHAPGFVLRTDLNFGVKLTAVLPPLLAAGLVALRWRVAALPGNWRGVIAGLRAARVPALWLLAAPLALLVAVLYLSRTGNEPLLAPAEFEQWTRVLLAEWLGVRPRFKEFLIGHPLLLLALATGLRGPWSLVLVGLGTVGQASVVNTFSHAHTPVQVSLVRTAHGLWLGTLAGLLLHAGVVRAAAKLGRRAAGTSPRAAGGR